MDLSAPFRLPSVLRKGQAIGSLGTSPRASYGGWLKSKETGNTALLDVVSSQSQELFEAAPVLRPHQVRSPSISIGRRMAVFRAWCAGRPGFGCVFITNAHTSPRGCWQTPTLPAWADGCQYVVRCLSITRTGLESLPMFQNQRNLLVSRNPHNTSQIMSLRSSGVVCCPRP